MPNPLWELIKLAYFTFKWLVLAILFFSFWTTTYGTAVVHWTGGQLKEICQLVQICD